MPQVRIVSWNVNGIRAAEKKGFLDWVERAAPDFVCVQETKAEPGQLGDALLHPVAGDGAVYHSAWASAKKRGYSGVAIYSRVEPRSVSFLGIDEFDDEGRALVADYGKFTLISAYFPNSQDAGARLPYKLRFCAVITDLCRRLVAEKKHFVLCGDYNVAHTEIDIARPRENEGNAGFLPEERAWFADFTGTDIHGEATGREAVAVDTFRRFYPGEGGHYSWWSYRAGARARNIGWRLDYHCVDSAFMAFVRDAAILSEVEGSDHCPVTLELDMNM